MKILHFDMGREWRGGQRQCMLLHIGLLERGVESCLVCRQDGEFSKKDIKNMQTTKFGGEISPITYKKFKAIINEIKPDIVHSHEAASLTPLLLAKLTGGKYQLVNTRRVDFSVNKNFISLKKYKNKQVNIVAVSDGIKNVLINDGIPAEDIRVIHSCTTPIKPVSGTAVADAKKLLGIEKDALVFGTVANFSPHKDYHTLLNAYKIYLSKANALSNLLLVGDGPLFDEIKYEAKVLGLANSVIFTGFRTDVPLMLSCMDIFVVSSYLEGLNTSIIDAFFLSKPAVATNTGGIPELVEDGVTGYLSPVRNPQIFADKMLQLANEPDKRKLFGKTAYKKAQGFTDNVMIEKYLKYYEELLA
ncbi:glycosyl transferase [Deferribacterales bacterium RsTz2092]|nr:glycosyl transferase [Deferribacterales bacterium]